MEAFYLNHGETLKASLHRVVVRIPEQKDEEKKIGSLFIPQNSMSNDKYSECSGVVIDIGPTAFKAFVGEKDPGVHLGDTVAFPRYSGVPGYDHDGHYYRVMNDEDIFGVIQPPAQAAAEEAA